MRKIAIVLAAALIAALLCGQALAVTGDITTKQVKAYADAKMTNYVGTLPAGASVLVRTYGDSADVYVGSGKVVYIDASALLRDGIDTQFTATLAKGTRIYQLPEADARSAKLTAAGPVKVCAISGSWALVQSTGTRGIYAYVAVDALTDIRME